MPLPVTAVVMFPRQFRAIGGFPQASVIFHSCFAQLWALGDKKLTHSFAFCEQACYIGMADISGRPVVGTVGALPKSPLPDCYIHLQAAHPPTLENCPRPTEAAQQLTLRNLPKDSSWKLVSDPRVSKWDNSGFGAPLDVGSGNLVLRKHSLFPHLVSLTSASPESTSTINYVSQNLHRRLSFQEIPPKTRLDKSE